MRAPVAPIGWPSAIAPPLTFSRSGSKPSSRSQARTWAANASLTSSRSNWWRRRESRSRSFFTAGTTPMPITLGSTPAAATPRTRAIGWTPSAAARSCDRSTIAAAPSVIPEELPAVTLPPTGLNAGGSFASDSGVVSRGCSSRVKSTSPFLPGTFTATVSASKRPSAIARAARSWLRIAKASCSSRPILYCSASVSAVSPITWPASGHRKPSWYMPSTRSWWPIR